MLKSRKAMKRFIFLVRLSACMFALICFTSVGDASSQPSYNGNLCEIIDFEDMRRRFSVSKRALNLDVGEPRTVRIVYFLPNDRPFQQDVVVSMKVTIRQSQTFYAEQMQAHGYGRKTFHFETDAQGEPIVHRVNGQHRDSFYRDARQIWDEIYNVFDSQANNVYFGVFDISHSAENRVFGSAAGKGGGGRDGGSLYVPGEFSWTTVAHELGHAFGLLHDFKDDVYIMSYGHDQRFQLSACHAEFLAVHPYFNSDIADRETPGPTMELVSSPEYPTGATGVPVQVKISDGDGLHQVILFVTTREPHFAAGSLEVKACRGLSGEREAIVEFDYDGVIPSDGGTGLSNPTIHEIQVRGIDTHGYVGRTNFRLADVSMVPPIVTLKGHQNEVNSVTFSPNGLTLASGSTDGTVKLWNVATGREITTLVEHQNKVNSVTFSPNGLTLASGLTDGTVKLWDIATGREITTLVDHKYEVHSMAFSPDGTTLASISTGSYLSLLTDGRIRVSGSIDGTVKLWDVATGREIATFVANPENDWLLSVAFSPDSSTLASGLTDGTVKLWDIATRREIATLVGHRNWITSVAFSPDGSMIASGSYDKTIKVWDIATGREIATLVGHKNAVLSMAFSSDGTTLASGSRREVKLWDVATRRNISTFFHFRHTDWVNSVSFSPTGRTLASGDADGMVFLSDMSQYITPTAFFPDVNLRTVIWDALGKARFTPITLMDLTSLTTLDASHRNIRNIAGLEFATNLTELNLVGNPLNHLSITTHIPALENKGVKVLFEKPTTLVKISGDNQEGVPGATLANPLVIEVRDQNGNVLQGTQVTFAVTAGDGTLSVRTTLTDATGKATNVLTLGGNPQTTIVEVIVPGLEPVTFRANIIMPTTLKHTDWVNSVAFSPDGKTLASGSYDNTVRLWDVATQREITTLTGHTDWVNSVAFSPDGTMLASGSDDQTVRLWDVATQREITTLTGHTDWVNSVAFSPDGKTFASGARDRTIRLWDVATKREITTLTGHTDWVNSVAFSPDGTMLASGSYDNTVRLWDVATQKEITTLTEHLNVVSSVAFSPDGTTLASGAVSWEAVRLWDVTTRTNTAILAEHTDWVNSVAFSPDGTMLVSGSDDQTVRLWDVATQREITILTGHTNDVNSVAFSPTGSTLASADKNGMVLLWKIIQGAQTLVKISGDNQEGVPGAALVNPLVVEVRNAYGQVLAGVQLMFTVTTGDGKLSVETAMTDATGRAESTLTLGRNSGPHIVSVTAAGIEEPVMFVSAALATPDFNGDRRVDFSDFLLFAGQFGLSRDDGGYDARYDLDGDGMIGFGDFLIFANAFGNKGS